MLRRAPNTTVSTARWSARELLQQNRSEADFNHLILHLARLLKADVHPRPGSLPVRATTGSPKAFHLITHDFSIRRALSILEGLRCGCVSQ